MSLFILLSVVAGAKIVQPQALCHLHRSSFSGTTTHPAGLRGKNTKGTHCIIEKWEFTLKKLNVVNDDGLHEKYDIFLQNEALPPPPTPVLLKLISCFLCAAGRAEGGHWKGSGDGAEFRPLLRCNHCEHGSKPGFPRAAQADRKAGHWATVGAHLLAVLEVTGSHWREPQGRRGETKEQKWMFPGARLNQKERQW